jgi:hypothetical protein
MANINTDMLKEKLYPVVSALFGISETLVDVSKSHISAEHAIDKIRSYIRDTDVICSRYRLDKVLDECTEIENDSISRSEAIRNLMLQPKLTKSVVRRVLAQTKENDVEKKILRYVVFDEELEVRGSWTNITFEQYFTEEGAAMEALKGHDRMLRYVSENGRTFREYYNKDSGEWD